VSEHVEEVRLCRGRSYGLVFETVPAVTCAASNGWVRSSRKSPRAPVPTGCYRCGEGWAWATIRESLLMPPAPRGAVLYHPRSGERLEEYLWI